MKAHYCPKELGVYNYQVWLEFPAHMYEENGGYYQTKEGCGIDPCLTEEIKRLWDDGIVTMGCCCGHGLTSGMINVMEKDVSAMVQMGYKLFNPNDDEGFHPWTFIPKTKCVNQESNNGQSEDC